MTGTAAEVVFVVDDDAAIRRALKRSLTARGFAVSCWADAAAFLREHDPESPGCLVADVAMPDVDGLQLQARLASSGCIRPIVFITGHGDIPSSVTAMRNGAVTFLQKPVRLADLESAIREGLERDRMRRDLRARRASIEARLANLTRREGQVLEHVVAGRLNKQIAAELGLAEKTVKVHRGRMMAKMGVRSVAQLVALVSRLETNGSPVA
jgi:FixJ family two-component response regulator